MPPLIGTTVGALPMKSKVTLTRVASSIDPPIASCALHVATVWVVNAQSMWSDAVQSLAWRLWLPT